MKPSTVLACNLAVGAALLRVPYGPVEPHAPLSVPSYLLSMASRPPLDLVFLLAEASIPSGVEIKQQDSADPTLPSKPEFESGVRIPASDLVRAFNTSHTDYQASILRDAIVIRPVAGSAQFLDSESTLSDAIVVVGTMAALRRIFSPVDPRLLGPAVGSELGWEASANMSKEFLVDGGGRRVIETLNQIAVQTPGAWQVTTRLAEGAPQIIAFGFVYRDRARGMVTLVDTGAR